MSWAGQIYPKLIATVVKGNEINAYIHTFIHAFIATPMLGFSFTMKKPGVANPSNFTKPFQVRRPTGYLSFATALVW